MHNFTLQGPQNGIESVILQATYIIDGNSFSLYLYGFTHVCSTIIYIEVNILHHVILEEVSTTANILPYKY
jgi:hypothetical protein